MANPIVTITMENGDVIKAELYPQIAPNTYFPSCYQRLHDSGRMPSWKWNREPWIQHQRRVLQQWIHKPVKT